MQIKYSWKNNKTYAVIEFSSESDFESFIEELRDDKAEYEKKDEISGEINESLPQKEEALVASQLQDLIEALNKGYKTVDKSSLFTIEIEDSFLLPYLNIPKNFESKKNMMILF